MFTGLIQAVGTVVQMTPNPFGVRLGIDPGAWDYKPKHGDSIAVSGCCLTHAPDGGDDKLLVFDVIKQTLEKTSLGDLNAGGRVNLESCVTPSTPLGGHFVQGHVDATARILRVINTAEEYRVRVQTDEHMAPYLTPTGSICVDGISLTLAAVNPAAMTFDVALIPTTLEWTTLGDKAEGDRVNLEADVLVKAVINYMRHHAGEGGSIGSVSLDKLREAGFAE
ncbi:MAG: riboflavin synthase [Planctomycetota bacterium]|jgi:riboflavin synthase